MIDLSHLVDWKDNNYDIIIIIVDYLTKIVYYKLVKTIINAVGLVEIIIDIVIRYYSLSVFIISN